MKREFRCNICGVVVTGRLNCDGNIMADRGPPDATQGPPSAARCVPCAELWTRLGWRDVVEAKLAAAGLPVVFCGLNADWSVCAWHLGPSNDPNRVDGDLYLLDNEDDADMFSIVQYDPSILDTDEDSEKAYTTIAADVYLWDAVGRAAVIVAMRKH